jgi:hypothetical protein
MDESRDRCRVVDTSIGSFGGDEVGNCLGLAEEVWATFVHVDVGDVVEPHRWCDVDEAPG